MSQQLVSAQVILKPASAIADKTTPVTAANISRFLPSAEKAAAVSEYFKEQGFTVGNLVGTNFSITAPAKTFEGTFQVKVLVNEKKGFHSKWKNGTVNDSLPVNFLPASTAQIIEAIVFPGPPDFGPTSF